jgi:hypothetical protein
MIDWQNETSLSNFFSQLPQQKLAKLTGALFWSAFHHPL